MLNKAREHFKMLATRYRGQLEKAIAGAGGIDNLSDEQKQLLEAVQEAGLSLNALANNQTMTELQARERAEHRTISNGPALFSPASCYIASCSGLWCLLMRKRRRPA